MVEESGKREAKTAVAAMEVEAAAAICPILGILERLCMVWILGLSFFSFLVLILCASPISGYPSIYIFSLLSGNRI